MSRPVHPRQHGVEYYVDHRGDQFYIITNADGKNYKVNITFCGGLVSKRIRD